MSDARKPHPITQDDKPQFAARGARRARSTKLGPAQIRVLAHRYYGGQNVTSLLADFGISRSSLFRYLREYADMRDKNKDMAWVITENGRLVSIVSRFVHEVAQLKAEISQLTALLGK